MTRPNTSRAERAIFLLIAMTTLILAILTPPFEVPDEPQHFSRATHYSLGHLHAETRGGRVGGYLPRAYADLSQVYLPLGDPAARRRYDLDDLTIAAKQRASDDDRIFTEFANVAAYAPTMYLPQVAAVGLGRMIGIGALDSFYLARLLNALTSILLLALAVRVIPFGRLALLAVAGLPTVVYHAASVSPDAMINGLAVAAVALSLRAGYGARRTVRAKTFLAASVLLGLCKGIYAPLTVAGFRPRRPWLFVAAAALAIGAFLLWTLIAGGNQPVYEVISRKTGKLVSTAPLSAQLRVILAAPGTFLGVLFHSVAERSPVYALQIVGRFGWNAILLPLVAYPLAAAMIAASVFAAGGRAIPLANRAWWLAIAAGSALLIELAMYLTATPLGADYIQGTQGRYFLPLLPLVFLALVPARVGLERRALAARAAFVAMALLHLVAVATVFDSFWITGFVTPEGMPAHPSAARAMFLPSPRW